MVSPFEIVVGIIAGGAAVNGALDRIRAMAKDRRNARERLANGPEPICGCGHHLAYHDLHDGRCYAEVKRKQSAAAAASADSDSPDGSEEADESESSEKSSKTVTVWHQCQCRRYAGPEPLASLYAPQISHHGAVEITDTRD